jgi:hypothetical protein
MGTINFKGDPPYELPIAQDAGASAVDEIVEVTLHVIVPGKRSSPAPIRVQMTIGAAANLKSQLEPAIRLAEIRARPAFRR